MPADRRPRVLSGAQPTADSYHLGNYFGAFKQWVALQDDGEAFYFLADLHALTIQPDPADLRARTMSTAAVAARSRPGPRSAARCSCRATFPSTRNSRGSSSLHRSGEAGRMTQFKDKSGKWTPSRATVGLYTYPS